MLCDTYCAKSHVLLYCIVLYAYVASDYRAQSMKRSASSEIK